MDRNYTALYRVEGDIDFKDFSDFIFEITGHRPCNIEEHFYDDRMYANYTITDQVPEDSEPENHFTMISQMISDAGYTNHLDEFFLDNQ